MSSGAGSAGGYNGGELLATAVSFLILTYISVGLRTYVRAVLTNGFQADDWLMLVAQAIFTLSCSFILTGVGEGLGHHNKDLPQDREIAALKWQALAAATYVLNMMFIKLSIAVFLLRLAVGRRYRWTLWGSMGVVTIWSLASFFWDIFQCSPVQAQWDYTIPNLRCASSEEVVSAAYSLSALSVLTDWLYALLPIPMVWNVKMTKQAKVTVMVILGLGIFASVATLIRLKYLADLNDTSDLLFAPTDAMVWTLVEPGVAILASSLVTVRPLLKQMKIPGFGSTANSRGGPTSGRSGGLRSGTQKSNGMPGFGPGDLTLIDIETGDADPRTGKRFPEPTTASDTTTLTDGQHQLGRGPRALPLHRISEVSSLAPPRSPVGDELRQSHSTPKSDVFVIEGPRRTDASWAADVPTPSVHSEDHEGVKVHNQSSDRWRNRLSPSWYTGASSPRGRRLSGLPIYSTFIGRRKG